jgi:osmoprotectant transport system substrate-binding protein
MRWLCGLDDLEFKVIGDGGGSATLIALLTNQVQAADSYTTTPSIPRTGS